jgi:outer membrane receptor protein involved in Fe transport
MKNTARKAGSSLTAISLALAAIEPAAGEQLVLEEVVVTAQIREQGLQDAPTAVSAMSYDQIGDQGFTNLQDITLFMPNVNINEGAATANIFIRGIGSGTNAGFEQSVGMYIDRVYSGRGQLTRVPFTMDLARIEVLKGPQDILFGKNRIAGAINVTSQLPSHDFDGYVEAQVAPDDGEQIYTGVINGGLTDTLAGRLAVPAADVIVLANPGSGASTFTS